MSFLLTTLICLFYCVNEMCKIVLLFTQPIELVDLQKKEGVQWMLKEVYLNEN